jgi:hypothetical protein
MVDLAHQVSNRKHDDSSTDGVRTVSTLMDRYRARRDSSRRRQAIERAIASSPTRGVRDELMALMNR